MPVTNFVALLLTEEGGCKDGADVMTLSRKSDPCPPDLAAFQTPSIINAMNRRWDELCPQLMECEIYIGSSPLEAVSKGKLFLHFRQKEALLFRQ